jgi:hypothetical protein
MDTIGLYGGILRLASTPSPRPSGERVGVRGFEPKINGWNTFYIQSCRYHNSIKVTTAPKTKASGFIRKGKALIFTAGGNKTLSQKTVNRILEEIRVERDERHAAGIRCGFVKMRPQGGR